MRGTRRPRAGRLPRSRLRLPSRTSTYAGLGFLLGLCLTLCGYLVDYYALYGAAPERWSLGVLQGLHDVTPVHYFTDLFGLLFALAGAVLGRLHDRLREYSENLEALVDQRTSALRFRALHDVETKLPNRTLFLERVRHAMERGRARRRRLAVLYLGLERIEQVHQTNGQEVGDLLIQQMVERLDACLQAFPFSIDLAAGEAVGLGDTLARIRNDEFAILLYDVRSTRDAIRLATRLLELTERPVEARGRDYRLGLSVGIALGPGEYRHHEHLLRDAHVAMNRARESGGSRFEMFDEEMKRSACEKLALEMELHQALDRDDLALWYQPIFNLRSGELDGFEALIRWHHAERGWVSPSAFIPLAEESDLIIRISRSALDAVFHTVQDWTERFPARPDLSVNVNLPARYLAHPSLLEDLGGLLERFAVDPSRVHLEITESSFIERPKEASEILHVLKKRGFRIALDDFGTGYSSLSILHELPIDVLKIDGRFVGRLGQDPGGRQIVATIVGLARTLGQQVVAEGIETGVQLQELQNLRCGFGQGFFLGRPASRQEVEAEYLVAAREALMVQGG